MMEEKQSQLTAYFKHQIEDCGNRRDTLLADDRADEADFEKVKSNIYDIFRTVLSAAVRTCKGDEDAVKQFFLMKTAQIPSNWTASYDRASLHNDMEKMRIERIKLDTIEEIKQMFEQIWEGAK